MHKQPTHLSPLPDDNQFQCNEALHTVSTNIAATETVHKKSKKMSSNRRRRQKLKRQKQQSRIALHEIIKNMCNLKTNFEQNIKTIDLLLQVDLDEDRFYEFISKVTREQMDIMASQIHELTANCCLSYRQNKAINSIQIARLFQIISRVKQASLQIQKVINYFQLKTGEDDVEGYLHRDLQYSTLKYIVQSDQMKEDFEQFCHTFIIQSKDKRQKIIIQQIIKIFKMAVQFQQQQPQDRIQSYDEIQVKHHSEFQQFDMHDRIAQMETQESQQNKKKKKKKKNKNKNKNKQQGQLQSYNQEIKEIQIFNHVIKNLSQLQIVKNGRNGCYVEESWLYKLKAKIQKERWIQNKDKKI